MRIFIVCLIAWFIAQVIKVIINTVKYIIDKKKGRKAKKVTLETLFKLGGMPSSHTATVISLAACVGLHSGFHSDVFAVSGVFAFITMFDALKVRLPISRLTDAFNRIQAKVCNDDAKDVKKVEGHTIPEIIGGIVVGISVALFMVKVVGIYDIEIPFIDWLP
ncbi:MAG: divergent PAP2 family protein [Ruminococcaceae bacterium]|nr:divergent PAP2 family protein [Oscillospiraceae bacterium]